MSLDDLLGYLILAPALGALAYVAVGWNVVYLIGKVYP